MISTHGLVRTVAAIALVVALAGCAAPVPAHTSSSAPTATPAPSPSAASAPGSRVPIGCADLVGTSNLASITGAAPHDFRDENSAPVNLTDVAQAQYGALECEWGPQGSTSTGAYLTVSVAPDAASAFRERFAAIMADQSLSAHPAATENVAGSQSGFWCATNVDALGADSTPPICDGELLESGYWVGIQVDTVTGLTRSQLVAAMPNVMTDIAGHLKSAGAAPAQWVAPSSTPPRFCAASTSTAAVRTIFGDSALAETSVPAQLTTASTIGLGDRYSRCEWTSPTSDTVGLQLLAGGSWAFPSFAPVISGESPLSGVPYSTLRVAGAASAIEACASGVCDAYLGVDSTLVEVGFNDPGAVRRASVLAALVKEFGE